VVGLETICAPASLFRCLGPPTRRRRRRTRPNELRSLEIDIRDAAMLRSGIRKSIPQISRCYTTAAPSPASHDPPPPLGRPPSSYRLRSQRKYGTLNLLEATRLHTPEANLHLLFDEAMSMRSCPTISALASRDFAQWPEAHRYHCGIAPTGTCLSGSTPPFGVSKAAARSLVQDYGRYLHANSRFRADV